MRSTIPRLVTQLLARRSLLDSRSRPLLVRPSFSRYPTSQRYVSSTAEPKSSGGVPVDPILNPAAPPTSPRPISRRYVRTMLTIFSFLLLGSMGGILVGSLIIPPPLPILDSEDDAALVAKLKRDISTMDIVKELRSPESKSAGWVEYEVFMGLPDEIRDRNMSAGAMRGARGLGLRRMWWNGKKKELVGMVFLGGGVAGWPGVVHGGALVTVLLEGIATVANGGPREIRGLMSANAVEDAEKEMVREFRIRYLKPTNANRLYIIRAGFQEDGDGLVECWLEDALSGRTTVKSSGRVGKQGAIVLGDGGAASEGFLGRLTKSIFGQQVHDGI